jgi:hypothetical protein
MDPRTNRFLAGAHLAAHGLFQEIAPALDARVLRAGGDPLGPSTTAGGSPRRAS